MSWIRDWFSEYSTPPRNSFPDDFTPENLKAAHQKSHENEIAKLRGIVMKNVELNRGEATSIPVKKFSYECTDTVRNELEKKNWEVEIKYYEHQGWSDTSMIVRPKNKYGKLNGPH